jgi:oxygen-independent coproporphyrinogen-3 oxidase
MATAYPETLTDALLQKYNTTGPRYTSYPTAPVWTETFDANAYTQVLTDTKAQGVAAGPLSLYVHIPFCEARCLFCGCNVVVTPQKEQAEKYLGYLFREMDHIAGLLDTSRRVVQYHWGGGTPTYLSPEQMRRVFEHHTSVFNLDPDAEIAIEVDPRVTTDEQLQLLRELGFNRLSMGVQDFSEQVQETVNRIQPIGMTEHMVDYSRQLGFGSINIDLIYGLPHQTLESFTNTVRQVIRLSPDRIALYNFAYLPWLSPYHKLLPADAIPEADIKFAIFRMAMQHLTEAGYVYIGMDHFAKPDDELAVALNEGRLFRNFMGYTVQHSRPNEPDSEMIGVGVSSISGLANHFAQNVKKLSDYYELIDANQLPTHRGYALSHDDRLRRQVILDILCQGQVDIPAIERAFAIDFREYFADAIAKLDEPTQDGLIGWSDCGYQLTTTGRILSRNVAMAFDAYLPAAQASDKPMFSKTV